MLFPETLRLTVSDPTERKRDSLASVQQRPSFGVAFVFMRLVGTFAGMSVSDFISDV
jgi:hypothetical protein